jgi:uncharacterized protein YdaU (DUF1376 family)
MTKLPSMPFFPVDFFADTEHLSPSARHAYAFLLLHGWIRSATLPNDDASLARLAGFRIDIWRKIKPQVMQFFELGPDGLLRNRRMSKELSYVVKKRERNSLNGALGGRPKSLKYNTLTKANGFDSETEVEAPTPTPISKKERDPRARALEFQQFWDLYGHKIDRPRAEKAMVKALEKATIERILDGVKSYRESLNDLKFIKDPAAWLNGERWNDQPALVNGHHVSPEKLSNAPQKFIEEGTEQWNAWDKCYRKVKNVGPPVMCHPVTHQRGWHFPTEWPPSMSSEL